ncbi:MAG TPA: ATP-binding protein [Steroidobacteraceae bacterium]|jgi:signal transduction histidine kinase|nr:ATP-binding protein [Steroidobacteraceae bacterium]
MVSIRARLLIALLALTTSMSLLAGAFTYRQVLAETDTLFDYQLRQMALSLRSQVSLAPRIELPPAQNDTDFVVQIWDLFGTRVYLSRPGLPTINRVVLGYADLDLNGERWRAYGLQTIDGVIQIAQPTRVREALARASALRVVIPLLLLIPILGAAIVFGVRNALLPLRRTALEVQQRDASSLEPLAVERLPAEVVPLIDELNRLLARVDSAFATQRAFIADAAHELRSPLTAVRLQLQLLDRATDDVARREARANLGAAVDRATHMIEQLLALARAEPRDAQIERQTVILETVAGEAIADANALAQTRHIETELQAEAPARVVGDAAALRALARNLVDNAVRYTPEGGRVIVRTRVNDRREALLEVIDNGPGIPAAERERAFDRFYRRAGSPAGGSGLGLAIVKAIAERHAATVTLADASGGGLHVTVTFPPPPDGARPT